MVGDMHAVMWKDNIRCTSCVQSSAYITRHHVDGKHVKGFFRSSVLSLAKATAIMKWRWDQGRLQYFGIDNVRAMAHVLVGLDGVPVGRAATEDFLDTPLKQGTGLPFARPDNYPLWRNYKRVFECSMLASVLDGRLQVSEMCQRLATNPDYGSDEFLYDFIPRFQYPYPAFEKEQQNEVREVYPFCAIGKLLVSAALLRKRGITLEDIFTKLIGNDATGTETLEQIARLPRTNYTPEGDEVRQLREMVAFISQLSFLKWTGDMLMLDMSSEQLAEANNLDVLFAPRPVADGVAPLFYRMTALDAGLPKPYSALPASLDDQLFLEGGKTRIAHLRIERSPLLRRMFINLNPEPLCDACERDMREVYPWTSYMIEIHHLLPLGSPLTVQLSGTSLEDVAGLCPNCHKSVHSYYGKWLSSKGQRDFRSKDEAKEVYHMVQMEIRS